MFENNKCLYVATYEKWFTHYYGDANFYKHIDEEKKLLEILGNEICFNHIILERIEYKLVPQKLYSANFNIILLTNHSKTLELFEEQIGHKFP